MAVLSKTQIEQLAERIEGDCKREYDELIAESTKPYCDLRRFTELQFMAADRLFGMRFMVSNLTAVDCISIKQREYLYGIIDKYRKAIYNAEYSKDGEQNETQPANQP